MFERDAVHIYGTGALGRSICDVLCFLDPAIGSRLRYVDSHRSGMVGSIPVIKRGDLSGDALRNGLFLLASTWQDELAANLPVDSDKIFCAEAWSGAVSSFRLLEQAFGDLRALKILDFGSGSGAFVALCRARAIECYGCDILPPPEPLRTRLGSAVLTPIEAPPNNFIVPYVPMAFPEGSFDVVVTCHVIEHLAHFAEAWSDLVRVTRPEGAHVHRIPGRLRLREIHTNALGGGLCSDRWFVELGQWLDRICGIAPVSPPAATVEYLKNCVFYGNNDRLVHSLERAFRTVRLQSEAGPLRHSWMRHSLADTQIIATGYCGT